MKFKGIQVKPSGVQVIAVLLTFLAASSQCLARCAEPVCQAPSAASSHAKPADPPPCHRRAPEKKPAPTTESCQLTPILVEDRAAAWSKVDLPLSGTAFDLPAWNSFAAVMEADGVALIRGESPPYSREPVLSTVLRL